MTHGPSPRSPSVPDASVEPVAAPPERGRVVGVVAVPGLLERALAGERAPLARLISGIERGGEAAAAISAAAFPLQRGARAIGITGAPGAGKSTLTERLIRVVRAEGGPVAVLAVDPSSPFSGGALLGDRVRMQEHATDASVFIRSMASRGHVGGLALAVPEAARLLDAVGFPLLIVETVGVGQVEVDVAAWADTTVVVVTPGWGDSVQASKAGLMEVADVFVVNKSDRAGAAQARRDLEAMLELSAGTGWRPPVLEVTASTGQGIPELWSALQGHAASLAGGGILEERRRRRSEREVEMIVRDLIAQEARRSLASPEWSGARRELAEHRRDPYRLATELVASLLRGQRG